MKVFRLITSYSFTGFLFFALINFAECAVIQLDTDLNGKMDQWQHKLGKKQLQKVEYDKNEDGQIDQIDTFNGHDKPIRVELDRNLDGTVDQTQYYSKTFVLERVEKTLNIQE